jgi:hypothetical protein
LWHAYRLKMATHPADGEEAIPASCEDYTMCRVCDEKIAKQE